MSSIYKKIEKISSYAMLLFLAFFILMFVKAWMNGQFSSKESFQLYIQGFGVFAPLILVLFQAIQVVIPVLPGFLGCAAGSVMFGTMTGFWCNYIGISVGSVIAFILARRYGKGLVDCLFSTGKYEKWANKVMKSKKLDAFMFVATLLPLFPDDYLCYLSGLTKMKLKTFVWIIILGKPWCILAYSIGFSFVG